MNLGLTLEENHVCLKKEEFALELKKKNHDLHIEACRQKFNE